MHVKYLFEIPQIEIIVFQLIFILFRDKTLTCHLADRKVVCNKQISH